MSIAEEATQTDCALGNNLQKINYFFFQNLISPARSSNFSLTYQPAAKPTTNPIVKNIIFSYQYLSLTTTKNVVQLGNGIRMFL